MNHAAYSLSCVTHAGDTSPNLPEFSSVGSSTGVGSPMANGVRPRLHVISDEEREGTLTRDQWLAALARATASYERHIAARDAALYDFDITGGFEFRGLASRHQIFADYAHRLHADLLQNCPEDVARTEGTPES